MLTRYADDETIAELSRKDEEIIKLRNRDAVLVEMLRRWLLFASNVQPGCPAGADELESLRHRTERLLPPNVELTGDGQVHRPASE